MKEKTAGPILFSGPMVRAQIEDRKTKTRRKVKNIPAAAAAAIDGGELLGTWTWIDGAGDPIGDGFLCPWGRPGDLLYVREEFRVSSFYDRMSPAQVPVVDTVRIHYEADGLPGWHGFGKKRENMYMPRWMSRITLELISVRMERLQEISVEDCWAEGIDQREYDTAVAYMQHHHILGTPAPLRGDTPARYVYAKLWEDLHGAGSWQENPFVWVLEFRVLQENVDTILQERIYA